MALGAPTPPASIAASGTTVGTLPCKFCGAAQLPDAVFCNKCGQRIAAAVVSSNRRGFKKAGAPLVTSRLVVTGDYRPPRRGFVADVLIFVRSLLIILFGGGFFLVFFGFLAFLAYGALTDRAASVPVPVPAILEQLAHRAQNAVGQSSPKPAAVAGEVLIRADGEVKPDTVNLLNARLERRGNELVAIGEVRNTSQRVAANVIVTTTLRDAAGNVLDVTNTTVVLLPPGATEAWKATMANHPTVAGAAWSGAWTWRS